MSPLRNDTETTTPCPLCTQAFLPVGRQVYCSPACRQAAWRARAARPERAVNRTPTTPGLTRRQITVYACGECDQRYLAEQWCPDCNRPCHRVDIGGLCPHCEEPVAIIDLLDQHMPSSTQNDPTNALTDASRPK